MVITNNVNAIRANRFLKINSTENDKKFPSLFAGEKGPLVQARYIMRAEKNTQDGISFIQTADGYLSETIDILQRIRELAVKSANGIYNNSDRSYIQAEVSSLIDEIDRVASQAQFNTLNILTGRFSNSVNALSQAISCEIFPASFKTSKSSASKNLSIRLDQSSIVIGICLLALASAKSKKAVTINSNCSNFSLLK